jgi:hypothetical protein
MSGRTDLMNRATVSMRSRTELMFQVVTVRRMGSLMPELRRAASEIQIVRWIMRAGPAIRAVA